jgi:hypothetical protein
MLRALSRGLISLFSLLKKLSKHAFPELACFILHVYHCVLLAKTSKKMPVLSLT